MKNYRERLKNEKCWDSVAHHLARVTGRPDARLLQNREELVQLCEWIESQHIRSYLEIGIWTGALVSLLQELFQFEKVAICDLGVVAKDFKLAVNLPDETQCFWGSSLSTEYLAWREKLGHIDLVMIDGDHRYEKVRQDFEINQSFSSRYLAFHDICNQDPNTRGVKRLWEELEGDKTSICLPFTETGLEDYRMGIGLIKTESARLVEHHA